MSDCLDLIGSPHHLPHFPTGGPGFRDSWPSLLAHCSRRHRGCDGPGRGHLRATTTPWPCMYVCLERHFVDTSSRCSFSRIPCLTSSTRPVLEGRPSDDAGRLHAEMFKAVSGECECELARSLGSPLCVLSLLNGTNSRRVPRVTHPVRSGSGALFITSSHSHSVLRRMMHPLS